MKSKNIWILLIIALVVVGFFFRGSLTALLESQVDAQTNATEQQGEGTVTIRPATDTTQVSAAGNITLAEQQAVVFQVSGIVTEIAVDVGDEVAAGDLLVALDATDLERAVQRAELDVETSQAELDQFLEPANPAEIASARANLASAQEQLAELQAGPSEAELAAAQAALTAAQTSYQELTAGLSEAELTELSVDLHKAYLTLQQAQEAYNEIAYTSTAGSSSQGMDLQDATIDYDAAKAAYDIATEPASEAEVQAALQSIKEAQVQLEDLTATQADLLAAEADVASAEATLADLLAGPSEAELHQAELAVEQAQLDLQEAQAQLAQASLLAPNDGTILLVEVELGQQASDETDAVTLADLSALELPVYVAEVDISQIHLDQPATITIDALPDEIFSGVVSRIAPTSESDSGVVNYEVTIRLDDLDLDGVRPGMTAVATLADANETPGWLVPTNALTEFEGETSVLVVRGGQETRVTVTPGLSQGEWTVVQSSDLQAGDQVVGEVASFVDEADNSTGGGPFGGGPPPN
jgi:HlyD family secretion protein